MRSRSVHAFGTFKENVAAQCRILRPHSFLTRNPRSKHCVPRKGFPCPCPREIFGFPIFVNVHKGSMDLALEGRDEADPFCLFVCLFVEPGSTNKQTNKQKGSASARFYKQTNKQTKGISLRLVSGSTPLTRSGHTANPSEKLRTHTSCAQ